MNTNTIYGVYYFSKSGNTKKLAVKIADTVGCMAKTVNEKVTESYRRALLRSFCILGRNRSQSKRFHTRFGCFKSRKSGYIFDICTGRACKTRNQETFRTKRHCSCRKRVFYCRGEFLLLHKGRPDEKDLSDVAAFAKMMMEE